MTGVSVEELRKVNSFPRLIELLRDKLDWPIGEDYEFEDVVFEYEPGELNLKPEERAKVREIHQLRPLVQGQPWGIFFISFEEKSISVTVLRRLLRGLVLKNRASAREATRQAWDKRDLIFAANFGKSGERELAIVHFADEKETNDLPVLKVLGWNAKDTFLHNDHVARVLSEKLKWPDDPDDLEKWRENWSGAFEVGHGEIARTSKELAVELAKLATDIRARANQLLAAEADDGAMRKMLEAFRKNLIQDLDEDGFADMFAQTIAYGLLAARISRPSGALVADNLTDMVPKTNPFLRELFETFLSLGGRDKRNEMDFDELGVRNVVDMLARANMEAVLRDFGDRNPKEDPVIHFYELFLKEYDPQKRMQRGVFYTPRPVVNFIVRGVDEILRTEFDLPLGLADTTTWAALAARNDKITIPEHVDPNAPFVQILDPATGTGTFLVEVIDLIHKRMIEHWRAQKWSGDEIQRRWNEYVPRHLLPRLTGFELMMAPYAIAHMKIGLKLIETGYKFGSDERAHVFLTNALEPPRDLDMEFVFIAEALAHEAQAANEAKLAGCATVVIGNPPYSIQSQNLSPRARSWVDIYRYCDGQKIVERNALQFEKNIQDDYVKFFSLSQQRVQTAGLGCLGLITNHSFLDGATFRGMRQSLSKTFQKIEIYDLHGNSNKKEEAPDGKADENVFEISQGVSITLGIRTFNEDRAKLLRCDLWGARTGAADAKYERLLLGRSSNWQMESIKLLPPLYLFASMTSNYIYEGWPLATDFFGSYSMGIKTSRDNLVVAFEADEAKRNVAAFVDPNLTDDEACEKYEVAKKKGWNIGRARSEVRAIKDVDSYVYPFLYRPFDIRKLFYHGALVFSAAFPVMQNLIRGDCIALVLTRQTKDQWDAQVTESLTGHKSLGAYDANSVFPLWLSPSTGETSRRANIDRKYAQSFERIIGLTYEDGVPPEKQKCFGSGELYDVKPEELLLDKTKLNERGDLAKSFGPRDLFDWIYGVLHSPGYRARYAEFLKSDFPRIPAPGSRELFAALVPLGAELVALHLLKTDEASVLQDPAQFDPAITFNGTGEARVERGFPRYENGKVMINATRWFEDVPKETWGFHVGGYQVCEKWHKDRAARGGKKPRPGRILTDADLLHYRRVVVALTETRRIMAEIDHVIDEHGGWPGAFAANKD